MFETSGVFGVGSLFYLFEGKFRLSRPGASISAAILFFCMFSHKLAPIACAFAGGYLIIWFAQRCRVVTLPRFDTSIDISYGLYLYAWPIQNVIIWTDRTISPWTLCIETLSVTAILGYLSWSFIEEPALRLAKRQLNVFRPAT